MKWNGMKKTWLCLLLRSTTINFICFEGIHVRVCSFITSINMNWHFTSHLIIDQKSPAITHNENTDELMSWCLVVLKKHISNRSTLFWTFVAFLVAPHSFLMCEYRKCLMLTGLMQGLFPWLEMHIAHYRKMMSFSMPGTFDV